MRINTNIEALNAHRNLEQTNQNMQKNLERLSSGQRINRAADDAAGLSISEKMRGQVSGLDQAVRNAQDSISLIQTAEGALEESHSILQRMRELAVQSANDTNIDADRGEIQEEIDQLAEELHRIEETTEFNTQNLVDGDFAGTFHIGANEGQNLQLNIDNMGASELGVGEEYTATNDEADLDEIAVADGETYEVVELDETLDGVFDGNGDAHYGLVNNEGEYVALADDEAQEFEFLDDAEADLDEIGSDEVSDESVDFGNTVDRGSVTIEENDEGEIEATARMGIEVDEQESADEAITDIDNAIDTVSSQRSELGALQNRLEHTINNLSVASENLSAAESRIRDVDMAEEMMDFSTQQVLEEAGTAMMAQANMQPQSVLQLLQ
ncbi:flagellin [Natranaerobius thermophilus]|uniref:Flagellin n=1 Tax=Natranaerobius thermophilus (strain ATCC BAA-1301 / DSM 18059 / JW/NM-WN-LF) TaxID=457570 RepID=B2A825_NATTJ|nr:flagellin [Natranaerobius thermophilus]ACB85797.1 flagellin domain protein [Natranaerobius thermophilus JW/NM-WN-LF]